MVRRSRNYRVIILPCILLIIATVGGAISTTRGYPEDTAGGNLSSIIKATIGVELTLNWLVTGLIAWRLYTCQRAVAGHTSSDTPYSRVIKGILESGLLISATSVVILVLFVLKVCTIRTS